MDSTALPGPFSWYALSEHGATPPKSLFVILLAFVLASLLPALGLWYLGFYPAMNWLGSISLLLLVCLLFDAVNTCGRYKAWGREWLCADCRVVFSLAGHQLDGGLSALKHG